MWCLKRARVSSENRFLLEERDLMQQQFQQLAERSPSRPLGIGTQGSETPFGTPCTRGAAVVIMLPCCRSITRACPTWCCVDKGKDNTGVGGTIRHA